MHAVFYSHRPPGLPLVNGGAMPCVAAYTHPCAHRVQKNVHPRVAGEFIKAVSLDFRSLFLKKIKCEPILKQKDEVLDMLYDRPKKPVDNLDLRIDTSYCHHRTKKFLIQRSYDEDPFFFYCIHFKIKIKAGLSPFYQRSPSVPYISSSKFLSWSVTQNFNV